MEQWLRVVVTEAVYFGVEVSRQQTRLVGQSFVWFVVKVVVATDCLRVVVAT